MRKKQSLTMIAFLLTGVLTVMFCSKADPVPEADPVPNEQVQRFGSVTGLKPDKMDYYKKLHAETWPGVLKAIKKANIRNYSIYLSEIEGKFYLFSYFEYIGTDFAADMAEIAKDTVTQRWWKETDPCQIPLSNRAEGEKIWMSIPEVFHTD